MIIADSAAGSSVFDVPFVRDFRAQYAREYVYYPAIRLCVLATDAQRVRAEAATTVGRIAQINVVRPAVRAYSRGVGTVGREVAEHKVRHTRDGFQEGASVQICD